MDWPQTVAEPPDYRSIILPDRVRLDFDQYFTSLYLEWLVDLGVMFIPIISSSSLSFICSTINPTTVWMD
jgi:hypothetical protein